MVPFFASKDRKLDLTEGTIWRVLIAFVLPIMAGSLIQQLYITVDAVVVGKFAGKEGLAAIDSVYTLFKFPINFMNGLSSGATIVISRYFGGKNEKELDCATHTLWGLWHCSVLCCFSLAGLWEECIIWIYIASWIVTGVVFSAVYLGKAKRVVA